MRRLTRLVVALAAPLTLAAANNQLLSWNNLGMHCMDSDYSVFSILPPYNTIEAQLIVNGHLVTNGTGLSVTYQAVADPDGSFNSTSRGKSSFFDFVLPLYGAAARPEFGLTPWPMPGTNNTPQGMLFEQTNQPAAGVATPVNWFRAEGIPLTPYDDAGRKNPYPMMRLIAHSGGTPIATNDIVLPVSDEMDCRACHASGTGAAAKPAAGWAWSSNPERDFRLNILRRHDEDQFNRNAGLYQAALAARGFNPQGLYRGVVADGKPVLCAICHASEALGLGSYSNIPPLTASVHAFHAHVMDPVLNVTLDNSANRAACYRCHPGSTTKCLRGAMGGAVASDGSMEMQCQSCHGNMSAVGSSSRVGWFMEPSCQNCHTGTATSNNGQIRFTSAFEASGAPRLAVNQTFATTPDAPAPGLSLYRFSRGHGGLQCEACHGSTHAEFPSTHRNDNVRNLAIQGHAGVTVECTACHPSMTANATNVSGGPHGLHPVTQDWVSNHHDLIGSGGRAACQACHGADYRGTVLSRAQADRSWNAFGTTLTFPRGAIIGCYSCHLGPSEDNRNSSAPPTVNNVSTNTTSGQPVAMAVSATPVTATLRILSQPASGTLGVSNLVLTYFPDPGFTGSVSFTFSAYDGSKNSSPGSGTVNVTQGPFSLAAAAHMLSNWPAGWPAPFAAIATPSNTAATITYDWDFGDGTAHSTNPYASHAYATPGTFPWTMVARAASAQATVAGSITIAGSMFLTAAQAGPFVTLTWPRTDADAVLEQIPVVSPALWKPSTNAVVAGPMTYQVKAANLGTEFYRLRLVQ